MNVYSTKQSVTAVGVSTLNRDRLRYGRIRYTTHTSTTVIMSLLLDLNRELWMYLELTIVKVRYW